MVCFYIKDVVFGTITNETIELLNDLSAREKIILFPLAFLIIFFGHISFTNFKLN